MMHSCSDSEQVLYALGHNSAYHSKHYIGRFWDSRLRRGPGQPRTKWRGTVKRDQYEDWDSPGTGRDMSTAAVDSCLSVAQCVHVDAGWIEVTAKAKATLESQWNVKKLRRIKTGDVIPRTSKYTAPWTLNAEPKLINHCRNLRMWRGNVFCRIYPRVCLSVCLSAIL